MLPYEAHDRAQLTAAIDEHGAPSFLFFFAHRPAKDGSMDAACLSQWFLLPFEIDGVMYPTTEHWMMAEKARLFGDTNVRDEILKTFEPSAVKWLGRQLAQFDEKVWKAERFDIVVRGNLAKFAQNDAAKAYLLSTAEQVLVEAAPKDRIWGIGMDHHNPRALHPQTWNGNNLLGFALMEVRARLMAG